MKVLVWKNPVDGRTNESLHEHTLKCCCNNCLAHRKQARQQDGCFFY